MNGLQMELQEQLIMDNMGLPLKIRHTIIPTMLIFLILAIVLYFMNIVYWKHCSIIVGIYILGLTIDAQRFRIWWFFDRIWAGICYPFAIIHVKWIQFRYKWITTRNPYAHTNRRSTLLQLLQAKEEYYKDQFTAWGRFHPSFSFSQRKSIRHRAWMDWLFPEKDFKEWDIVIWHKSQAVTYYHNKIYNLTKGRPPAYEIKIIKQLKEWNKPKDWEK